MPKEKKCHSDIMKTICGICTRKFDPSELRGISDSDLILIKKYVFDQYDLSRMPSKACRSCKKTLVFIDENGKKAGKNVPTVKYEDLRLPSPAATRNQALGCQCSFCEIGRMKGSDYANHCAKVRAPVGRPSADGDNAPPVAQKICSYCKGKQTTQNNIQFLFSINKSCSQGLFTRASRIPATKLLGTIILFKV